MAAPDSYSGKVRLVSLRFIKVTSVDNAEVMYVNADQIFSVREYASFTVLFKEGGTWEHVREKAAEVLKLIEAA